MGRNNLPRRTLMKLSSVTGIGMLAGCQAPFAADDRDPVEPAPTTQVDRIAADPTDVPPPVDWDEPREHEISMETPEVVAELESGTAFDYMTFDGQIPGPLVRVRRGDRVTFELSNPSDNDAPHNIDFHAVYGPGGGAEDTTIAPGQSAEISFRATYPGIFIYHCAVPDFDHHISRGMFGAILVEPEEGLPEVDRELYFGQHEIYTKAALGEDGRVPFDHDAMRAEDPTYVTYNGEPYAFTDDRYGPIEVDQDETVRIFFVNGGPNKMSSFHGIGNVWSRLYRDGDLVSDPARFVETTGVPPGTATVVEMETPVPGPIRLVDHAVSRPISRGTLGIIDVLGEERPDIYDGGEGGETDYGNETRNFDGWFDDVGNYTGVVDETGTERTTVVVGSEANGGKFGFEPAAIEVSPGTTVEWEWTGGGGSHNVVHEDGAFESDLVGEEGYTFEHTFDEAGEFKYVCTPHETIGMKGIVVVG